MDLHSLEQRSNGVIEYRRIVVLRFDVVDEVAWIHAVESTEEHVKAVLQMDEFALFHVRWMIGHQCEMIEDLKHVVEKARDRLWDDRQQRDETVNTQNENLHITLNLQQFQQLFEERMVDDFVQPSWMSAYDLNEETNCCFLLQAARIFETHLQLVENVSVVGLNDSSIYQHFADAY